MNLKKIALLAAAFICTTGSMTAATVEEIAQNIKNGTTKVDDTVLYDGNEYVITHVTIATNDTCENIFFDLTKYLYFLGTSWGNNIISVELKNEKITNGHSVTIKHFQFYNETKIIMALMGILITSKMLTNKITKISNNATFQPKIWGTN